MKAYEEVEALVNPFLISTLYGSKWPASHSGVFAREERALVIHWIADRVGPSPAVNVPTTIPTRSFRVCYAVLAIFISDLITSHYGQTWLHHKRVPWRKSEISQTQTK